jgi:hypothetical protein
MRLLETEYIIRIPSHVRLDFPKSKEFVIVSSYDLQNMTYKGSIADQIRL